MNDNSESLNNLLLRLNACEDAREWGNTQPDLRTAWSVCQRADWMLWLAEMLLPRESVVLAACDCAETAVHLIEDGGSQMAALFALHIAREWTEGREDLETVRAVADAVSASTLGRDSVSYAAAASSYAANIANDANGYAIDAAAYAASYAASSYAADPAADEAFYNRLTYTVAHAATAGVPATGKHPKAPACVPRSPSWVSRSTVARAAADAALSRMADLVRTCISADMICEVQNER